MLPQECSVVFLGYPSVGEGDGVTLLKGQIMGSPTGFHIVATKMVNDTKGSTFISDGAKKMAGTGWKWPHFEDPIWGRAKDISINPRATMFTLEVEVHGTANIISNCPEGCLHIGNMYWDPGTEEVVIKTKEEKE